MLLGTRQKLEHSSDIAIQSQGQKIERVSSFCYLGVTLDEHLSWNEHVEIICHKVSKRLLDYCHAYDPTLIKKLLNVYKTVLYNQFLTIQTQYGVACQLVVVKI